MNLGIDLNLQFPHDCLKHSINICKPTKYLCMTLLLYNEERCKNHYSLCCLNSFIFSSTHSYYSIPYIVKCSCKFSGLKQICLKPVLLSPGRTWKAHSVSVSASISLGNN